MLTEFPSEWQLGWQTLPPCRCPGSQHRQNLPEEKVQASLQQHFLCKRAERALKLSAIVTLSAWSVKSLRTRVKADTPWLSVLLLGTLVGHTIPVLVLLKMSSNPGQPFQRKDEGPHSPPVGLGH